MASVQLSNGVTVELKEYTHWIDKKFNEIMLEGVVLNADPKTGEMVQSSIPVVNASRATEYLVSAISGLEVAELDRLSPLDYAKLSLAVNEQKEAGKKKE